MPNYGAPLELTQRSLTSVLVIDPTLGYDVSKPSPNLAPGATPNADNFIMRDGALEPRPMLSRVTGTDNNARPFGITRILGGMEAIAVDSTRYPMVSSTTRLAYFAGSWSVASYVSAFGLSDPPAGAATDYWDWTQIFYDLQNENIAVGALTSDSRQSLYCWQIGTGQFSTLTGAPGAKAVCAFDNYILAGNVRDTDGTEVQRVRWSDRGSASSWTGGLSGFEDLLDAKGAITRLAAREADVIVFTESEIWHGTPIDFPFTFKFSRLDKTVGCPYPWTIDTTSRGIVFLGDDFQLYLLPKEGGAAQPVGQTIRRSVRDTIVFPGRSFGVYDPYAGQYQFYYPQSGASENLPMRALFLDFSSGAWAPQSFSRQSGYIALTRGFAVRSSFSRGTAWNDYDPVTGATWNSFTASWDDMRGVGNERKRIYLGSSTGTMYELDSRVTSDDGNPVQAFWETGGLGGAWPTAQKTVTQVDLDYDAASASSATVRVSPSQGAVFDTGTRISLRTSSAITQESVYPRIPARYPVVRVEVEGFRPRLQRLNVTLRVGGR